MTLNDIQHEATTDRWHDQACAVVVDGQDGKEYRPLGDREPRAFDECQERVALAESSDPLDERIDSTRPSPNARGLSGLTRYGINNFGKVFNGRQKFALVTFVECTRQLPGTISNAPPSDWSEAVYAELALAIDRVADRNSTLCHWDKGYEKIAGTFQRYALRVNWDYCEVNPFSTTTGNYIDAVEWICRFVEHALYSSNGKASPRVILGNARTIDSACQEVDLILTDPPYYDAIPYADLSDFFYIWLRRTLADRFPHEFSSRITGKDEELIQHASRGNGNNVEARKWYEDGMAESFASASGVLAQNGRFVVVFAHKHPDAWEALVSSIVRAGFVVDASWPIQTEMPNKAAGGARLASSVWLVCKKRPATARPGWDNKVMEEMRSNIATRLREFWDAGIRGPDFVWAATGPALEAYSKHPVVKKANEAGKTMEVGEFLSHVRRMVVDFVVGQVLTGDGGGADLAAADRMDAPTAYYLLHRHDFGLEEAPTGACILYATACGLSDHDLETTWDILVRTGGSSNGAPEEDEENEDADADAEADPDSASDSGSKVKLKTWAQRKHKSMGYEAPGGQPVPLIDRIHRLMHLWRAGDVLKVDEYLDEHGLRRHELFRRLLQSLIELSPASSDERSLLESLSNHVGAKGAKWEAPQAPLPLSVEE
jgi:hypothetical protein